MYTGSHTHLSSVQHVIVEEMRKEKSKENGKNNTGYNIIAVKMRRQI